MTVINDVKTTLAGLKSAQASFETFALSTDNQQAKQLYHDACSHKPNPLLTTLNHVFNKSNKKNLNTNNNNEYDEKIG